MGIVQTFETTIVNRDIPMAAQAFIVPKRSFDAMSMPTVMSSSPSDDISDVLGLTLGIPVLSPELLPTVLFAAMAGRTATFDEGSFDRWRRQMAPEDPRVGFARQLVYEDLLPVESSPLDKVSLESLSVRAPAWVIAGSEVWAERPLAALGIVVAGEFGAVVVGVIRASGASAAIAAKYHTRRKLGVPTDWVPPEDRN